MADEAIPNYEMVLKSNEELQEKLKLIRLAPNETANVSCRIYDSGFDSNFLSFTKNGKAVTQSNGIGYTYQVKSYKVSSGPINFTCSAKRSNGKVQTRLMRVTGSLMRELYDDEVPCPINKCQNDGLCVSQKNPTKHDIDFCICPINFKGNNCDYLHTVWSDVDPRTEATTNATYLYLSMALLFLVAVVFGVLYGREKLKRAKTKKQLRQQEESTSLQAYEVCDGREDAAYNQQQVTKTYVINEYDNVPADERIKLNTQRPIIRGTNTRDSIGITEEIARAGRLKPDYGPSMARPVLTNTPNLQN